MWFVGVKLVIFTEVATFRVNSQEMCITLNCQSLC